MAVRSATGGVSTRTQRRNCTHHWTLERPEAQASQGTCAKCGMTKKFLNYGEELRLPFGRRRRF